MIVSDVTICSNALILLGDTAIASFTDGSTGADVSSALYEGTYEALLSETRWHFATTVLDLARISMPPDNNWQYSFQMPTDLIYLVKTTEYNYEVYEDKIYTNSKQLQIEYVRKMEEAKLPSYFVKALEFALASQFAIPITGNTSRAEEYRKMYEMQIRRARNADSSQRPNEGILDAPYLSVRFD